MAIAKPRDFLIVNGVSFPVPAPGMEIISTQNVDAGRNANGAVVGQLVGRRLWKINNLQFNGIDADTWATIKKALEPFFVPVTFTGDDNQRHTVTMYPSDTTGQPLHINGLSYDRFLSCKFNLIDCGW